jgi:hypothetical protein
MQQYAWGYASDTMYHQRWALIEPQMTRDRFTLIDWGSDSGWFSVTTALAFPRSNVLAVDGSVMLGDTNIQQHLAKIAEEKIENDSLVNSLFDANTFAALKSHAVNYQYALSVFHWMGDGIGRPLSDKNDWDQAFLDLIQCAEVTFFEVPNEDNPQETPHRIRAWYNGRTVDQTISDAIRRSGTNATITLLGDIEHSNKGRRTLFMIRSDVLAIDASRSPEVVEIIRVAGSKIRLPFSLVARSKLRKFKKILSAYTLSA